MEPITLECKTMPLGITMCDEAAAVFNRSPLDDALAANFEESLKQESARLDALFMSFAVPRHILEGCGRDDVGPDAIVEG